jgi:predicted cupin superfamily sugar epimerase
MFPRSAQDVIGALGLAPLDIEDGYFRELYRCGCLAHTQQPRSCATIIYYLLTGTQRSAWHTVASDELWCHLDGVPARQARIDRDGTWSETLLGTELQSGQSRHTLVPAGVWQSTVPASSRADDWALFTCTVAPGFDYADFTSAGCEALIARFPRCAERLREWKG